MNFKFIYVDDDRKDRNRIKKAIAAHNRRRKTLVKLTLVEADDVASLRKKLKADIDLVLADVNFVIGQNNVPRLKEILDAISTWSSNKRQSPIPVISYTGFAKGTLSVSLDERERLIDIWDKDSSSPEYITWRLAKIASDLSRLRPDTFLLRLIQQMKNGAKWHDLVKEMPVSYNIGNTEKDQIEGVGQLILKIGQRLAVREQVKEMWHVMSQWENLSRAVSATVRGHARHVVNVFWMGYYMIHHPILSPWFINRWSALLSRRATELRKGISEEDRGIPYERLRSLERVLSDEDCLESLSNAWYFAALFHDVGSCVPKYRDFRKAGDALVNTFGYHLESIPKDWIPKNVDQDAVSLLSEMPTSMSEHFLPLWKKSLKNETPDHGVVGALNMRHRFQGTPEMSNAFEATRAILAHNLIGELEKEETDILDWDDEPLACLLILCDQIQTWDRERGDEGIYGPDFPSRAQLTDLNIRRNETLRVEMSVQYVVPSHVEHSYVLYLRMKERLEQVLQDKPVRALARIGKKWPFHLQINCSLGGEKPLESITMGATDS